jgi:hypothetical protein
VPPVNGHSSGGDGATNGIDAPPSLQLSLNHLSGAPLPFAISRDVLHPTPDTREDDSCRAYMRPSELAQAGLFSGAWVVLTGKASRLARAYALDPHLALPEYARGSTQPCIG